MLLVEEKVNHWLKTGLSFYKVLFEALWFCYCVGLGLFKGLFLMCMKWAV